MIYGYARVSTQGQSKDGNSLVEQRQSILERYGDAEIVSEVYSGAKERPVFLALLDRLSAGDTLVVTKLDRFCRTTKEGLQYIDLLLNKGVRIHILNMGLVEDTAMGRLIVTNLLAFAEFERAMIRERTSAGKSVKRSMDPEWREGRKRKEVENISEYVEKQRSGEMTVKQICTVLGISRSTYYKLAA